MDETTLSVFVDESGRFQHPDPSSRFYIVGMVFHDQRVDVSKLIEGGRGPGTNDTVAAVL